MFSSQNNSGIRLFFFDDSDVAKEEDDDDEDDEDAEGRVRVKDEDEDEDDSATDEWGGACDCDSDMHCNAARSAYCSNPLVFTNESCADRFRVSTMVCTFSTASSATSRTCCRTVAFF